MERGEFLGFTFGDYSSDNLEIIRVSSGDRYEEQLHPEIKDRTAEVPGLNGEYYFGSDYGTRSFDIEFAFDHLTEVQFRKLRRAFGTKRIQSLVFDERPYKKYMAKLESPVELSYVCFDEPKKIVVGTAVGDERYGVRVANRTVTSNTEQVEDEETGEVTEVTTYTTTIERERIYPYERREGTERIYKGEGKMTLVCYYPFAKSNFKVLPEKGNEYYEGSEEWAISSGILSAAQKLENKIDIFQSTEPIVQDGTTIPTGIIKIYNAGDVETGFRLYIPREALGEEIVLSYGEAQLVIEPFALETGDEGVIIDTNTGLIVGLKASTARVAQIDEKTGQVVEVVETGKPLHIDYNGNVSYTTSGKLYNAYVKTGYFFKFEPNDFEQYSTLQIVGASGDFQIFYDYLYF